MTDIKTSTKQKYRFISCCSPWEAEEKINKEAKLGYEVVSIASSSLYSLFICLRLRDPIGGSYTS